MLKARSSVGEHYLDAVGVGGSIPPVPTKHGMSRREGSAKREPFKRTTMFQVPVAGTLIEDLVLPVGR